MGHLNLDALEFSPVYHCLLSGQVYDFFASDCSAACPEGKDLYVGQCVRNKCCSETTLVTSWRLQVQCSERCWHDKLDIVLHSIQIFAADHLDIPFQEVEEVNLDVLQQNERRLGDHGYEEKAVLLRIKVRTRRGDSQLVSDLMNTLLLDPSTASHLLGLDVIGVVLNVDLADFADDNNSLSSLASVTVATDPLVSAYASAGARDGPVSVAVASPTSFLPPAAIIGIAAGIVFLGSAFAILVWCRRRRHRQLVVKGKEVNDGCMDKAIDQYCTDPKKEQQPAEVATNEGNCCVGSSSGNPESTDVILRDVSV